MKAVSQLDVPKKVRTYDNEKKSNFIKSIVRDELIPNFEQLTQFEEFFSYMNSSECYKDSMHYFRYINTCGEIMSSFQEIKNLNIIETGSASPLTIFLSDNNSCYKTESDLRIKIDAENNFADLVFSFEVLEHIKDIPEESFDEVVLFQGSGAKQYAKELTRVIKPGGFLVLTSPNPNSYQVISNTINEKPPYIYRPHVREYTRTEVLELFSDLELVSHKTLFNFFMLSARARRQMNELFDKMSWSKENRGDDHFFVFRKPLE